MNVFFSKIGIILFLVCFFCGEVDEFFEYFFVICYYIKIFWVEVIKWMGN